MPISLAHLPAELHYIIPLAEQHGTDARVATYNQRLRRHIPYAETLSDADIEPLRQLYEQIQANDHGPTINNWHSSHSGKKSCPSETIWPVYGLLCLFKQLAQLDIAPFNDGAIQPKDDADKQPLDWTKLPSELMYLAEPATRYGAIQFENKIIHFLEYEATEDDRQTLRSLQPLLERDSDTIETWIDTLGITNHREAALVYFLSLLMFIGIDEGWL